MFESLLYNRFREAKKLNNLVIMTINKYETIKKTILELNFNDLDLGKVSDLREIQELSRIFRSLSQQFYEMATMEVSKRMLKEKPWLVIKKLIDPKIRQ